MPVRGLGVGAARTSGGVLCAAGDDASGGADVTCLLDGRWSAVGRLRVPRRGAVVVAEGRLLHVIGGTPSDGAPSDVHEVLSTH